MNQHAIDAVLERIGGRDLFLWHRNHGTEIDASNYLARYRRILANGLSNTRRIYLDTNYWIRLRDATRGRSNDAGNEFLQLMQSLVRSRSVICVNHHASFSELARQEGESLKYTASVADELTQGVAIAPTSELRYWEAGAYIAARLGLIYEDSLGPWTKVGQIFHSNLPALPPMDPAGKRAIYKALLDTLWNANLFDIFAQFGWDTKKAFGFGIEQSAIENVEKRKEGQLQKKWSRDRTRKNEFAWVLRNYYEEIFVEQVSHMNAKLDLQGRGIRVENLDRALLNAAYKDFAADQLGPFLPSAVVMTELYSLYEHDSLRKHDERLE